MSEANPSIRRVLLVLRTNHGLPREIVRGILAFSRSLTSERWLLDHRLPEQTDFKPGEYDGVIIGASGGPALEKLRREGRRVITVVNRSADCPWPYVGVQDEQVGERAAQHLIERGYRRVAFVCFPRSFAERRLVGLSRGLKAVGVKPAVFRRGKLGKAWLGKVERPAAVFASNDIVGHAVINQCRAAGVDVPHDIAVLGVDNDDLLCQTVDPQLSSVALPGRRIGYSASELLRRAMRGESPLVDIEHPPGLLVIRSSSDVYATNDDRADRIMRVIRDHLHRAIDVNEIARLSHISRWTVSRCVREALDTTPLKLLQTFRVERAALLLLETDEPLERIANRCGYRVTPRLVEAFKRHYGVTPAVYRQSAQPLTPEDEKPPSP